MLEIIDRKSALDLNFVKEYLKITHNAEDNLIMQLIYVAEDYFEKRFETTVGMKTFLYKKQAKLSNITFQYYPLINIDSVTANNAELSYNVHHDWTFKKFTIIFPANQANLKIIFRCGQIKIQNQFIQNAILLHVVKLYLNRETSLSLADLNEIYSPVTYVRF